MYHSHELTARTIGLRKYNKTQQLLSVSDVVVWIFSKSKKYPHCLAIFLIPKKILIFSLCLGE
jgi:hypothetical protein